MIRSPAFADFQGLDPLVEEFDLFGIRPGFNNEVVFHLLLAGAVKFQVDARVGLPVEHRLKGGHLGAPFGWNHSPGND